MQSILSYLESIYCLRWHWWHPWWLHGLLQARMKFLHCSNDTFTHSYVPYVWYITHNHVNKETSGWEKRLFIRKIMLFFIILDQMYRFQCSFQIFPTSSPYNVQNVTEWDIFEKWKMEVIRCCPRLCSALSPHFCTARKWPGNKEETMKAWEWAGREQRRQRNEVEAGKAWEWDYTYQGFTRDFSWGVVM